LQGNNPTYSLNKRLGKHQSWSGIEKSFGTHPAHSPDTVSIQVFELEDHTSEPIINFKISSNMPSHYT
jgi:hypothetical protein